MKTNLCVAALAASLALAAACGGGSSKDKTPTSAPPSPTRSAATTPAGTPTAATPARTQTPAPTAATASAPPPTAAANATSAPAATTAPASNGRVFDETQARALLDESSVKPSDVAPDWKISVDTATDNAAAAATDPTGAASFDRCGRLAGRLVITSPGDVTNAYITGQIVSLFSQLTVYKTAAGAADCAAEGATRFAAPGALARAFGTIFKNPDAVTVQLIDYPQVADGSFAAALTGDIDAGGLTVQLQIVIVAFRSGNTSAVVGVAYSPLTTPSTAELKPYVDQVAQKIAANQ